ncbi:hypothetical protein ZWY2020_053254 [Hordeum vulgare]|nr:hypothetical protein ZWY2020_053254 [Hordeum vulgare]
MKRGCSVCSSSNKNNNNKSTTAYATNGAIRVHRHLLVLRKYLTGAGTLGAQQSRRWHRRCVRSQVRSVQYRKLGDSDLLISEITLGTMTFGEQSTEKESHDMLSYSLDQGINMLDTAEIYPIQPKEETQGRTDLYVGRWMKSKPRDKVILATKVSGYSDRTFLRDNAEMVRVDAPNIKESVEKSLSRLSTDYIDLLHIHWYVALYGEFSYDSTKWRLKLYRRFNETSYGVMRFVQAAKLHGLPKIVSIQNGYSLLVRCSFEVDLAEVCHPNNCNIGLLAYSPLGSGVLTGKYLDDSCGNSKSFRLNLFPGYMQRYNALLAKEATKEYLKVAKKHVLTPVQLALGFVRDRPFTASTIIGVTTMDQLKENINAFTSAPRPLPPQVLDDIETVFKRYRDPAVL